MRTLRLCGPLAIGLALVLLRQGWGSVVVFGLLLVFALYLDSEGRRADDVEELREWAEAEFNRHSEANGKHLSDLAASAREMREKVAEHATRLDAMAQQQKGPLL